MNHYLDLESSDIQGKVKDLDPFSEPLSGPGVLRYTGERLRTWIHSGNHYLDLESSDIQGTG